MTSTVMGRLLFSAGVTAVALIRFSLSSATAPHLRSPSSNNLLEEEIVVTADTDDSAAGGTVYTDEANHDAISNLPGLDYDPGFQQFSGYLTVDKDHGRNIFYWFVESQDDPGKDPVVLWTNGGPGCSSLSGFGTEHGPFFIDKQGKLSPNPYSWNQVASMLYVEQPAGVGFSYSDTDSDYTTDDRHAAVDNYVLIQEFFKKFPERQSNDFYIASESYGGHYIPQLTKEILDRNTDGAINFRGFLVGNPYVDPWSNTLTQFGAYYAHGLLAKPLFDKWVETCADIENYDPEKCTSLQQAMFQEMGAGINRYALDYPACTEEGAIQIWPPKTGMLQHLHSSSSQGIRLLQEQSVTNNPPFLPPQDQYKPCAETHLNTYLNRNDVRAALRVKDDTHWDACSNDVDYSAKDIMTPTIDLYDKLIDMAVDNSHGLNMMVYSGDDDAICSTAGTQYWIYDLGVDPAKDQLWKAWKVNDQTAGFVTHFDLGADATAKFVFATVHGAGHEVPSYRPLEALELFKTYLSGEW